MFFGQLRFVSAGCPSSFDHSLGTGDRLAAAQEWVEGAGVKVPLLSGAGSGNYWEAVKGSTNEIQAGGGVLFCMNYAESHDVDGQAGKFQHALKMQIQIISIAGTKSAALSRRASLYDSDSDMYAGEDEGRVVGDAGFKTMFPSGGRLPNVISHEGLVRRR